MRAYLLFLVGTQIFMDTSATYTDVMYLGYFDDFEQIHQWNWGAACLVYLYTKLSEGCKWKTKQMTDNITLLTVKFLGICGVLLIILIPLLINNYCYFRVGS